MTTPRWHLRDRVIEFGRRPLVMGIVYLLLFLYFRTIGGYKTVHIDAPAPAGVRR